jgi:hypothetical protein
MLCNQIFACNPVPKKPVCVATYRFSNNQKSPGAIQHNPKPLNIEGKKGGRWLFEGKRSKRG